MSFLRDIAQNVAGKQFQVGELIPIGVDPHEWQPTPADLVTVAKSDLVIVNGGGLEGALLKDVQNAGGQAEVVTASRGLAPRVPKLGEPGYGQSTEVDPHWWLDPIDVVTYVNNIRDAYAAADPGTPPPTAPTPPPTSPSSRRSTPGSGPRSRPSRRPTACSS